MQISIERTKPLLGSYTELPPGLRDKTKAILNIRSNKLNCLRLCITATLHPVTENATREIKYIANLVEVSRRQRSQSRTLREMLQLCQR